MHYDYIQQVFSETAQHYNELKAHHAAKLLLLPKGSPQVRVINKGKYIYLRQYAGPKNRHELYISPYSDLTFNSLSASVAVRRDSLKNLSSIKVALSKLWIPKNDINRINYLPLIKDLFHTFEKEGLLEAGVVLVGAWCFNVYSNVLGLHASLLKKHDLDFSITLPLRGGFRDIPKIVKQLGFDESIDYSSEKSIFSAKGLIIEFIAPHATKYKSHKQAIRKQLRVTPEAFQYVYLLTDQSEEFKVRGLGKVILPSIEGFILYRFLMLPDWKVEAKQLKDISQILSLVYFVLKDDGRSECLVSIFNGFNNSWKRRIKKVLNRLPISANHPEQKELINELLNALYVKY